MMFVSVLFVECKHAVSFLDINNLVSHDLKFPASVRLNLAKV